MSAIHLGACLTVATVPVTAQDPAIHFDLTAVDGARLRATHYSPGRPGPGVILLHQCNMDRRSWNTLASALVARGIHVITFDYRGYGESARGSRDAWDGDADRALQHLLAVPGVDGDRIAAGGASCGVDNAVQLARRSERIKALMLLSGPIQDNGKRYLSEHPGIAIFGAGDVNEGAMALTDIRAVAATSRHAATRVTALRNAGHGAVMFAADSALLPAAVEWFVRVLR